MFGRKPKNKPVQISIHVKEEPIDQIYIRTLQISSDGTKYTVEMEKPIVNGKVGWTLDVTGCIRNSTTGYYAECFRGAPKAIYIDTSNKEYTFSKLTNDQMAEVIRLKIFKVHYGDIIKDILAAIKPWLMVMIIVGVIALAIGGYNAYVISKLPENIHLVMPTATPYPGGLT